MNGLPTNESLIIERSRVTTVAIFWCASFLLSNAVWFAFRNPVQQKDVVQIDFINGLPHEILHIKGGALVESGLRVRPVPAWRIMNIYPDTGKYTDSELEPTR